MQTPIVDTRNKDLKRDDALMAEVRERFQAASLYEDVNHRNARDDIRMLMGEGHWPEEVVRERTNDKRPTLTINKLPGFVDRVVGEGRLNEVRIKVLPYGGGATQQVADVIGGIIRGIENNSNADIAYETGLDCAVSSGFGYWRVITDYVDEDSFDQEIRISRIRNNFSVLFDPSSVEFDRRDARFCFVSEMVDREEYKRLYNVDLTPFQSSHGDPDSSYWFSEKEVRVAEYWVKEPLRRTIHLLSDGRVVNADDWDRISDDLKANERLVHFIPQPDGTIQTVDGPPPEGSGYQSQVINPTPTIVKSRTIDHYQIRMYLVDGEKVIDGPFDHLGRFIPIVEVSGKETVLDGRRYVRSLIRNSKDSQRTYNYFRTAAAETVALAPKAPYVADYRQIQDFEDIWATANSKNHPYLPYKHITGVAPPQRQIVSQTAIGEITEANIASDEIKATTGIYDASLGQRSNEVSGVAINARKIESDVANAAFIDNLRRSIRYTGEILVDLIPKIYDTARQIPIVKEDEVEEFVPVNQPVIDEATGQEVIINDLSLGRYKIAVTTGPSFTTQRIEAANSMLDFVRVAPAAATAMIDLIAEGLGWPGSDKVAKRIRKLFPALQDIDGDEPPAPQPPDLEKVIQGLKAESMELNNQKKRLDIAEAQGENAQALSQAVNSAVRGVLAELLGKQPTQNENSTAGGDQ